MGNTFTRPPRVVGGNRQSISAKDFNLLARGIEELQNAISPVVSGKITARNPPPFWTSIGGTSPDFTVTPTLGFLTYQNATASASDQGVTGYIVPKIEGVAMDDAEVEPLPLPGVVSFVYLRVKTDADGAPKFDGESVTIEAFEEAQQSIHHVRPSPSGGEEEGDYFFLLLETEGDGGTPEKPRAVRRLTGNRALPNQLVEITNIGGKRELYEGYLPGPDDKHQFRTLEQLVADGEPIIKPLEAEAEEGETIQFKDIAPGERAQIEINTSAGGDSVIIEGNGVIESITLAGGGSIAVDDGLVTELTQGESGANLNLTVNAIDYDEGGSIFGSPYLLYVLYFRGGLYIGTTDPEDEPEPLDELTILTVGT